MTHNTYWLFFMLLEPTNRLLGQIAVLLLLAGCSGQLLPTPKAAPVELIEDNMQTSDSVLRYDGIYCSGEIMGTGSPGGIGVWPFTSDPVSRSFREFIRFDVSGKVYRLLASEPVSLDDAKRYFRDQRDNKWIVSGSYTACGNQMKFTLKGLTADGVTSSAVECVGFIGTGVVYIAKDSGAEFSPDQRYDSRLYSFVHD